MPFAVLKSIREVSSEDKLHSASNLLQNEPAKKWKTGELEEKSAYVIIEMETDYLIKGIDIGNECSAFVEVQVGNATCARDKFKELLITCSFMTPIESKTCSMTNRVRCFGREALVKETASEKWKLLKIICSQPFNKDIKYGLSFIKVHVDEPTKTKNASDTLMNRTFGSFNLREDSPDSETESTTALFSRWKAEKNKKLNGISSVPRNPTPAALKKTMESPIVKKAITSVLTPSIKKDNGDERPAVHDRNRNSLVFTDDDDDEQSVQAKRRKKLEKLEKVIAADQERVTKETEKSKKPKNHESTKKETKREEKSKKHEANVSHSEKDRPSKSPNAAKEANPPSTSRQRRPSSSPCVSDKPKKPKLDKSVQYKPFNQLLNGVVLVISGIQNPDRADLRNKALALGAKYKADWDSSSTHLICAFKNTPKYNQVKGVGKIVTRSWIEDCHSKKTKIPWRRYALDSAEILKPESEDEILDVSLKPQDESRPITNRKDSDDSDDILTKYDHIETNNMQYISSGSDTEDEIQKVLAKKSPKRRKPPKAKDALEVTKYDDIETNNSQCISSGSDTEDDIQKVLSKRTPKKQIPQTSEVFEVSTEEEEYVSRKKQVVPDNTKFFNKMKFFISDQLSATLKIKVERFIETFDGVLTTSIDEANYLIANNRIADVGEFKGQTVTPLWIEECNDAECLIPTTRYLVK